MGGNGSELPGQAGGGTRCPGGFSSGGQSSGFEHSATCLDGRLHLLEQLPGWRRLVVPVSACLGCLQFGHDFLGHFLRDFLVVAELFGVQAATAR